MRLRESNVNWVTYVQMALGSRSLLKSLIWADSYLRVSSKQMERTPWSKQPVCTVHQKSMKTMSVKIGFTNIMANSKKYFIPLYTMHLTQDRHVVQGWNTRFFRCSFWCSINVLSTYFCCKTHILRTKKLWEYLVAVVNSCLFYYGKMLEELNSFNKYV